MIAGLFSGPFLQHALLPMIALEVMIVAFYILYVTRIWPEMPWREAVIYAPLAIPLGFLLFFVLLNLVSRPSPPLSSFADKLALVAGTPWLAGMVTGAITYRLIRRRRSR